MRTTPRSVAVAVAIATASIVLYVVAPHAVEARGGATVATSPAGGPAGTIFELTGTGFPPLWTGSVTFDGIALGALSSDENGTVRGFFMVPDVRPGPARVRVVFGKVRADATFTVTGG